MQKTAILILISVFVLSSCTVTSTTPYTADTYKSAKFAPENITQSLFSDKEATISEENIQRILSGSYSLPSKIRIAVVNIENQQQARYYWDDEDYLSSRQKYLDVLVNNLKDQPQVESVSLIPKMLLPASPTFTSIREAGIRMQADLIIIYSIEGGMYSKYKLFKGSTYKAFATTQVLAVDSRTGLVPFTRVISDDEISKKDDEDFNGDEARKRIQESAVIKTLDRICTDLSLFLK